MSRFHVGDKVVFDMNAYVADTGGKSSWADEVPTTPMTISDIDGHTHKMEETIYVFHDKWLRPAKFEFREKGLGIERVLFNDPATIVFWTDGTKTVVKCRKGDKWDAEKGLAMACAKKLMGNRDGYHKTLATHYRNSEPAPDEMRRELQEYCHGRWCGNCVINKHRQDPRCVCGMGHDFTANKHSLAHISDADIRFFYKWLKDGMRDG